MVRAESEVDGQFRLIALANLGFLLYLSGDLDGARRALAGAYRDPLSSQRPYGHILALAAAALVALDDGDRQAGERYARESLVYARAVGLLDNQVTGLAHVALGRALLAAGQWQAAWAELEQSVQVFRSGIMDAWHVYALLWAAPLCQRLGDDAAAFALVDEAETLVARFTDAGTLTALLADARRRMTLARRRRQVGPAELHRSPAQRAAAAARSALTAGDRAGPRRVAQHREDALAGDPSQARRQHARRRGRTRPGDRPDLNSDPVPRQNSGPSWTCEVRSWLAEAYAVGEQKRLPG